MLAIYKKELRSYFINPIGYVYMGIFLAVSAMACCYTTIVSSSYDTSTYFMVMVFALVVLIPILTMRLFAEEKKLKTEQILLTAPVTISGMVLGKFFAALTLYASTILLSCINFLPLYIVADIERAGLTYSQQQIGPVTSQIVGSLIGMFLLGAAFIAVGAFISSLTENQLSSAVISIGVLLLMVIFSFLNNLTDSNSQEIISSYTIRFIISWFSVLSRFEYFGNGYFEFSSLVYYLSITFVFLFLTVRVYEKRRWG